MLRLSRCLLRRVSSVCSSLSFVTRVTVSVLILSIPFRQRTGLCSPKHRGSDSWWGMSSHGFGDGISPKMLRCSGQVLPCREDRALEQQSSRWLKASFFFHANQTYNWLIPRGLHGVTGDKDPLGSCGVPAEAGMKVTGDPQCLGILQGHPTFPPQHVCLAMLVELALFE